MAFCIASLFGIRIFSFVIAVTLDMVCFAYEKRSTTNCSQEVLISNPLRLSLLWITTSNFTCIIVLAWLYKRPLDATFCGFKSCFIKLLKNDSFWSLNLIFCTILIDSVVRCMHGSGSEKMAYPLCVALDRLLSLLVLYSLNYVNSIVWSRQPRTFQGLFILVTYWLGLAFYLLENFYSFISNSLDMAENIYPLGSSSSNQDRLFLVLLSLVIGAKVAFHIRMIAFFWRKMFHGDKDLMSDDTVLEKIPDC